MKHCRAHGSIGNTWELARRTVHTEMGDIYTNCGSVLYMVLLAVSSLYILHTTRK